MPNIVYSEEHPQNSAPVQGTLFPEMKEGGSPGEAEKGDDITGLVLKGLSDSDDAPGRGADGGGLSMAPQPPLEGQPAPQSQERSVAIEDTNPQDVPQGRPRTAADRIRQLTHRYRQEQREKSELETQLSQVLDVMKQQGRELSELRGTLARPPSGRAVPQEPSDDILGLDGSQPSPAKHADPATGVPMTPDTLRAIVTDAISSYDQNRRQQESARDQLAAAQESSFAEAVKEMPALRDSRTKAHQIFSELYGSSPLRTLPDGPYQIALQVRGILADEQADAAGAAGQVNEDRLRRAALPPQPSATDIPQGNRAALQKEYEKLSVERKRGNEDYNVYRRWRMLREALRQTR